MARLPRTFRPALNEQLRNWELLFPAEQRRLESQLDWLSHLPAGEFQRLFAAIVELESRMELPRWDASASGLTVQDVGLLARSPLYPKWRVEAETVFSTIDNGVEKAGRLRKEPRLVMCVLPPGLPATPQDYWPDLAKGGSWVPLAGLFKGFLTPLASALAGRKLPEGTEKIESTWIFECEPRLSSLAESSGATVLSWASLAAARREFLSRLNTIRRDLASVDRTNEELKRMDIARLLGHPAGAEPRVREFIRALFLSGNGSLIFNNSFVQWGASEALRRVQPTVLMACFGIRPKLKPFSSTVLFEDQTRSNPVADEDDPAGSLTDALELARYVHLAAQRLANRQDSVLTLMAACDLDRVLVLGGKPPAVESGRITPEELTKFALSWVRGR
jgi:hypothetical protein